MGEVGGVLRVPIREELLAVGQTHPGQGGSVIVGELAERTIAIDAKRDIGMRVTDCHEVLCLARGDLHLERQNAHCGQQTYPLEGSIDPDRDRCRHGRRRARQE